MTFSPRGDEFRVNSQTSGTQNEPDIAALTNGGYVVAWADASGDGSGASIKAQLYSSLGATVGSELLVNTQAIGNQFAPRVTALNGGGFVVTWTDASGVSDGSFSGIVAQVFDAAGVKVGAEFLVNTQAYSSQVTPAVAPLTNGGFVITWYDYPSGGIKAQLYGPSGAAVGGEFLVNTQNATSQLAPQVAGLADGGFVITWQDSSGTLGDSSSTSVKAQVYNAAGTTVGGEFLVNTVTAGSQGSPEITGLSGGGFVIAWQDSGSSGNIKAQMFNAAGAKLGAELLVNTQSPAQADPSVTALADGGFLVTWTDLTNSQDGDIRAQAFDAAGVKSGAEFLVSTLPAHFQGASAVTALNDGGLVVAWADLAGTLFSGADGSIEARAYQLEVDPRPVLSDLNPDATDTPTFTENALTAVNLLPAPPTHFITDPDSTLISKATVTITGGYVPGVDLLNAATSGNIGVSYTDGVLLLSGLDTIENYEAVLRTVFYSSGSEDPTNGGASTTRTFSWVVYDESDTASNIDTTTLNIVAINDAPAAAITLNTYVAPAQTVLNLKNNGLLVSDVDANAATVTVTLSVTEGELDVTAGGSGAGVSGSGTTSVTITGTIAQINALLVSDGTSTVSYINNSDNPAASVTLTLAINDGGNTGGGSLGAQETAFIVLDPADPRPVLSDLNPTEADTPTFTENPSTVVNLLPAPPTHFIADADSTLISKATVTITGGFLPGVDWLNAVTSGGNIGVSYAEGVLLLSGLDTIDNYEAVLRTVFYGSGSEDPTGGGASTTRTFSWVVYDESNTASNVDTTMLNVVAVNDAPAAVITPTGYNATEQTALNLKNSGLSVSDVDANVSSVTVTLSVTEGVLNITAGGSGAGVSGSGTSSVTITGTIAQINALLGSDGTSTVSYIDNSDDPASSVTLTLAIDDGGNTGGGSLTAQDTATISIAAVNDQPSAVVQASYNATENVALNLKGTIAVNDVDARVGTETLTLSVTEGILNVIAGGSGAIVSNSGTNSVTITGTLVQLQALLGSDATSTVQYVENDDTPPATATLTVRIDDNGNTGGGNPVRADDAHDQHRGGE